MIYYLSKLDDGIFRGFGVIPKITSANSCKAIHDILNCYSTFLCLFASGKCEKEGQKLQKSRERRAFLMK